MYTHIERSSLHTRALNVYNPLAVVSGFRYCVVGLLDFSAVCLAVAEG